MLATISLYAMAAFYVFGGIIHFVKPKFYLRMMPPWIPLHLEVVYISGVAEIALGGALLIPGLRAYAAWGIIALLVAVFPANFYMYQQRKTLFRKYPAWGLFARLPLQHVLIAWAYWHTLAP